MKSYQFSELRLRNFRCFRDRQTARLRPLTLLVGDNSTGKTSFLAAVRSIWDSVYQQAELDFRAPPYDLGAFREIVYREDEDEDRDDSFEIGFSGLGHRRKFNADTTFETRSAAPFPTRLSLSSKNIWIVFVFPEEPEDCIIEFGTGGSSWRCRLNRRYYASPATWGYLFFIATDPNRPDGLRMTMEKVSGPTDTPDSKTIDTVSRVLHDLSILSSGRLFASAPIRSSPHRTYDPTKPLPDPEGAYIPTYFANVNFRNKKEWNDLKKYLEMFGRMSGLFREIGVKQLGDMEGGPFQLEIKMGGSGEARRMRNLIDVGYGVSQVLPVLTEVLRPDAPSMMLFQQPEVHLHPSAQAALGSLFCSVAAAGRQLIVETHSDYIIDRILLDIRDKRTDLKPEDVSILYFERGDRDVTIHSIRIDAEGNVLDAPEGYRKFFKDELNRVIDY